MDKVILSENFKNRVNALEAHVKERMKNILKDELKYVHNTFVFRNSEIGTLQRDYIYKKDTDSVFTGYKRELSYKNQNGTAKVYQLIQETDIKGINYNLPQEKFDIENDEVVCNNRLQIRILNIDDILKKSLQSNIIEDFKKLLMMVSLNHRTTIETKKIDFLCSENEKVEHEFVDILNFSIKLKSESKSRRFNIFMNKKIVIQKAYWRMIAYYLFEDVFNVFDKEEFCYLDIEKIKEQMDLLSY